LLKSITAPHAAFKLLLLTLVWNLPLLGKIAAPDVAVYLSVEHKETHTPQSTSVVNTAIHTPQLTLLWNVTFPDAALGLTRIIIVPHAASAFNVTRKHYSSTRCI
jgi:hypothetical protein